MIKSVIGIGNALTDMLVNISSDEVLSEYGLSKGSMSLVDGEFQTNISKAVAGAPHSLSLGGSAGNTIRCMARLGTRVGFIGKVGNDGTGDFYEQALRNIGVQPFILRSDKRSGKCLSLVSADGERTLVTHLGAASDMHKEDISEGMFKGYDCLYVEGYLVQDNELIRTTVERAKEEGLRVALDLASFNVVEESREFLRSLVADCVDIIFANEDEARAFTGEAKPEDALQHIGTMCELAVVKIGMRGALIKRGSEELHVGIMEAAKRVDTTGAGDFYAAGFLSALCEGLDLRACGTLGAITAGKVIEVVGTTFGEESWNEIFALRDKVRSHTLLF